MSKSTSLKVKMLPWSASASNHSLVVGVTLVLAKMSESVPKWHWTSTCSECTNNKPVVSWKFMEIDTELLRHLWCNSLNYKAWPRKPCGFKSRSSSLSSLSTIKSKKKKQTVKAQLRGKTSSLFFFFLAASGRGYQSLHRAEQRRTWELRKTERRRGEKKENDTDREEERRGRQQISEESKRTVFLLALKETRSCRKNPTLLFYTMTSCTGSTRLQNPNITFPQFIIFSIYVAWLWHL